MIVYKGKLLKTYWNQKSMLVLSTLVTGFQTSLFKHHYMAFKHHFSFCNWFGCKLWLLMDQNHASQWSHCQTLFPSFCVQPSEAAVMLNSNLSRRPFLGEVVDLGLLLCTGLNSGHALTLAKVHFLYWKLGDKQQLNLK